MYGANNEPAFDFTGGPPYGTWKWDVCTSEEYWNNFSATAMAQLNEPVLKKIQLRKKP